MKANELRIGNLLKRHGVLSTIDARSIFDFDHYGHQYESITLTPQWLERLGFRKEKEGVFTISHMDYSYVLESKQNYKFKNDDGYFMGIRFDDWHDPITVNKFAYDNIKYVHQLQNLYFALTGQELTIANPQQSQEPRQ